MVRAPLTLALTGDVMLGRLVNDAILTLGAAYPWGNLRPTLRRADLRLSNLECAITREQESWHDGTYKVFYFRADPVAGDTLRIAGVDVASLANNHAGDFGTAGLLETIRLLDAAGIAHAGAGADLAAARAPARLSAAGWRVAVVAFADHPVEWAAGPDRPGINYTPVSVDPADFAAVAETLAALRRDADLVIFSIHWGPNMRPRPTPTFRAFARLVIEAGADIFWGHSTHLVQGIEVYRDRLILYDTGDFVDDYAVDPELRNDLSALFLVRVAPDGRLGLEAVPVHIMDRQAMLAEEPERAWFVQRLRGLCAEMGTAVTVDPEAGTVVVRQA
ncbi:MAG: CapA family protein [Sphaerobacter sp.]|nr:CapA family protein [Sphaerobacter sp.]